VLDLCTGEAQAADLGYVVIGREARRGGRMGQEETAMTGKKRPMIFD
jgi:hypothetical protein